MRIELSYITVWMQTSGTQIRNVHAHVHKELLLILQSGQRGPFTLIKQFHRNEQYALVPIA